MNIYINTGVIFFIIEKCELVENIKKMSKNKRKIKILMYKVFE